MSPGPRPAPDRFEFTFGFALAITLLAAFLRFLLVVLLGRGGPLSPAAYGFCALAGYVALFAVVAPRLPQPPRLALGLVAPHPRAWLAIMLLLPAALLVSEVDNWVQVLLPAPEGAREHSPPGAFELVQLVLVQVVALPVAEEVFFRGMIQPRMAERLGSAAGVLSTALLSTVPVLPLGLIWSGTVALCQALLLGALRQSTGSTVASGALHAGYGAIVVAAAAGVFGIPGFDDLGAAHTPLAYLAPAAFSAVLGFLLLRGIRAEG